MSAGDGTVPCKHCDSPTFMTSTELCDECWELEHRIEHVSLYVLTKIIDYVRDDVPKLIEGLRKLI